MIFWYELGGLVSSVSRKSSFSFRNCCNDRSSPFPWVFSILLLPLLPILETFSLPSFIHFPERNIESDLVPSYDLSKWKSTQIHYLGVGLVTYVTHQPAFCRKQSWIRSRRSQLISWTPLSLTIPQLLQFSFHFAIFPLRLTQIKQTWGMFSVKVLGWRIPKEFSKPCMHRNIIWDTEFDNGGKLFLIRLLQSIFHIKFIFCLAYLRSLLLQCVLFLISRLFRSTTPHR